jgi:thimet oligopeptidase
VNYLNYALQYQVSDSGDGTLLGYFYLDLHPRDGKYTHACNIPLQVSYTKEDGSRVPAVVAMLCNFSKPCGNRPALLYHDEVETYFHEFGHVMHCLCSKASTAVFSGFSGVQKDFIECPSQMLENWVWHAEPLDRMSKHFEVSCQLNIFNQPS